MLHPHLGIYKDTVITQAATAIDFVSEYISVGDSINFRTIKRSCR